MKKSYEEFEKDLKNLLIKDFKKNPEFYADRILKDRGKILDYEYNYKICISSKLKKYISKTYDVIFLNGENPNEETFISLYFNPKEITGLYYHDNSINIITKVHQITSFKTNISEFLNLVLDVLPKECDIRFSNKEESKKIKNIFSRKSDGFKLKFAIEYPSLYDKLVGIR